VPSRTVRIIAPFAAGGSADVLTCITGPAVIEDGRSTLLVPPGAVATREANGNLVVELPA
jgi:N-methylhydantoinase A/oxoprolinase/acetone carboxylase beta subunit